MFDTNDVPHDDDNDHNNNNGDNTEAAETTEDHDEAAKPTVTTMDDIDYDAELANIGDLDDWMQDDD
jgi:hypothetical protein